MRGEQAILNLDIKKKSGLSLNPDIHHSKVFSFDPSKVVCYKCWLNLRNALCLIIDIIYLETFWFVLNAWSLRKLKNYITSVFWAGLTLRCCGVCRDLVSLSLSPLKLNDNNTDLLQPTNIFKLTKYFRIYFRVW